jgi:hypothetical protein
MTKNENLLRTVLNGALFVRIKKKDNDYTAKIEEKSKDAKLKTFSLSGLPGNAILLKWDKFKVDGLFEKGQGQCKRCDFLLLTVNNKKRFAVFIELKSRIKKQPEEEKYIRQFKGGECLLDYVESVLNRFYGKNNFFSDYKKQFVVFFPQIPLDKKPTTQLAGSHSTPEKALEYGVQNNGAVDWRDLVQSFDG